MVAQNGAGKAPFRADPAQAGTGNPPPPGLAALSRPE